MNLLLLYHRRILAFCQMYWFRVEKEEGGINIRDGLRVTYRH